MTQNQKLAKALKEIKEISRIDSAIFTGEGEVAAATFEPQEGLGKKVRQFAEVCAEALTMDGFHFLRIPLSQTEEEYVLLVRAAVEESYMVGRLAVCQIRNLLEAESQRVNKSSFLQQVLYGNISGDELYGRAKRLHISQSEWVVYVIRTVGKKDMATVETLKNLFSDGEKDFLIEIDEQSIALIKDVKELDEPDELEALARMISDNVQAEAMQQVSIGYGKKAQSLTEITRSYQEALLALEIGKIFYGQDSILAFDRLGIGKLVFQMPEELCRDFVKEVFDGREELLDEEDVKTIRRFFDNDLNISETARQMYVHRNTLVYRLERIEKAVGLDVRKFDDAMKFRLALMCKERLGSRESELIDME